MCIGWTDGRSIVARCGAMDHGFEFRSKSLSCHVGVDGDIDATRCSAVQYGETCKYFWRSRGQSTGRRFLVYELELELEPNGLLQFPHRYYEICQVGCLCSAEPPEPSRAIFMQYFALKV